MRAICKLHDFENKSRVSALHVALSVAVSVGYIFGINSLSLTKSFTKSFTTFAEKPDQIFFYQLNTTKYTKNRLKSDQNQLFLPPLGIFIGGCEQSTVIVNLARLLVNAHGFKTQTPMFSDTMEMFKPGHKPTKPVKPVVEMLRCKFMCNRAPFWNMSKITDVLEFAYERAAKENRTLVMKYSIDGLEQASPLLKSLKARVVIVHRRNFLDKIICGVRDCANDSPGFYPVDVVTNQESKLCFKRRKRKKIKTKAHLNFTTLLDEFDRIRGLHQNVVDSLNYLVHNESQPFVSELAESKNASVFIASEDLLKFESDFKDSSLVASVKTWVRLLHAWGIIGDHGVIRKILDGSELRGIRPEQPTAARLANPEEVHHVLRNTKYAKYFRQ